MEEQKAAGRYPEDEKGFPGTGNGGDASLEKGEGKKGNRIFGSLVILLLFLMIMENVSQIMDHISEKDEMPVSLMTPMEEAAAMPDEGLYTLLAEELVEKVDGIEQEDLLDRLEETALVFYVLDYFDLEVQNGGLCQFYINSSKRTAPYVSKALEAVGAESYRQLFDEFNERNGIDTKNLSAFSIKKLEEFDRQCARYPFEQFDEAYYELYKREPLNQMLIRYARRNLSELYSD